MGQFRGIVQMYKEYTVEASTQAEAKEKIEIEFKKLGFLGRYTINEPKDLSKVKKNDKK